MDLMIFLKNYSMKYVKKDSKNDLSMLLVTPIMINTPHGKGVCFWSRWVEVEFFTFFGHAMTRIFKYE